MQGSYAIVALALVVSIVAGITDVRQRRIPNRLTYTAILAGLAMQTALYGWRGLLLSAAGGLLFGGVFLFLYVVHAMGAGDVKLAAALGCIVGLSGTAPLMFTIAITGGVLAVLHMIYYGRVVETLRNTVSVLGFHMHFGWKTHPVANLENPAAARMPYGLATAGGTLYWAIFLAQWR
jgi:prepilin peptidase CpaA